MFVCNTAQALCVCVRVCMCVRVWYQISIHFDNCLNQILSCVYDERERERERERLTESETLLSNIIKQNC